MVNFEILLDAEGRLPLGVLPDVTKYGLYVFSLAGTTIRVGESSSGRDRITKGFRQPLRHIRRKKERKNYLAYSWRESHAGKSIIVDYFNLPESPFSDSHIRRSLEAEVVFHIRIQTGCWPTEMSEIHFLEVHRCHQDVVSQASRVLGRFGYKYQGDI